MVAVDVFTSGYASLLFVLALFAGMVLLLEVGRRIGLSRLASNPKGAAAGMGSIEGAVFALLGLLIAFTFSGAAARFDARRHLVAEEANAIGTAYLRLDLLPPAAQPELREGFRRYLDARMSAYRKLPDVAAAMDEVRRATAMQAEIWRAAVAASRDTSVAAMLVLPALNAMFDIATTRTVAAQTHPPPVIFAMLGALALACALLAGVGMAEATTRSWIHMIGFAAIMAVGVYLILDIEHPRVGLIRVDAVDQVLVDVRESMN